MALTVTEEIAARVREDLRAKWPGLGIKVEVDEALYAADGVVIFRAGFVGLTIGAVPWRIIDEAAKLPERLGDELAGWMDQAISKHLADALEKRATL